MASRRAEIPDDHRHIDALTGWPVSVYLQLPHLSEFKGHEMITISVIYTKRDHSQKI